MKMIKLLITGSNGQLGSDCFDFYSKIDKHLEVVGMDLPLIDFSNKIECFNFLDNYKPNIIINCAAFTEVDKCENDSTCWKANKDIPDNLSLWASKNDAYLIHISTDYVFDGEKANDEFWLEDDVTNPLSEYGKSKLAGEKIIKKNMDNFSIIRTAWLYGSKGNNFLKTMLKLTIEQSKLINNGQQKFIKVVNDQFGSPTSTESLVKQINLIIDKKLTGTFHATSEGYCSWYDFANECAEEMKITPFFIPCSSNEYKTKAIRPKNSILENRRLKEEEINYFSNWKIELRKFIENNNDLLKKELELI